MHCFIWRHNNAMQSLILCNRRVVSCRQSCMVIDTRRMKVPFLFISSWRCRINVWHLIVLRTRKTNNCRRVVKLVYFDFRQMKVSRNDGLTLYQSKTSRLHYLLGFAWNTSYTLTFKPNRRILIPAEKEKRNCMDPWGKINWRRMPYRRNGLAVQLCYTCPATNNICLSRCTRRTRREKKRNQKCHRDED